MKSEVSQEQLVASAVEAFEAATGQRNVSDSPEEGYYTASQWSKMLNRVSICNTKASLDRLVERGLADKRIYKTRGQAAAHYKMKENK